MHKKGRNVGNRENTRRDFKTIFKLPLSTAYTRILMETEIWPGEQRIQNETLMLYHNIKNSDEEKIKKMIEGTSEKELQNQFLQKKYSR